MPYMKFSNKWYYTIGILIYAFNFCIVMVLRFFYIGNSKLASNPVQYIVSTCAALI